MKKVLRASGLLCAVLCLSYSLSTSPAHAWSKDEASDTVRTAQMRLANYLLTIHRDGSFTMPREIGNCSASYEAHMADNALFISFPGNASLQGMTTWDVWRYRDNTLVRL